MGRQQQSILEERDYLDPFWTIFEMILKTALCETFSCNPYM